MTIKDNWKQELEQLKLTDVQKERMTARVKQPSIKRKKSFVPIIGPAFVILALFSIWLTIQPQTNYKTASQDTMKEIMFQPLNLEIILWITATLILMMSSYTLFILNCLNTLITSHHTIKPNPSNTINKDVVIFTKGFIA